MVSREDCYSITGYCLEKMNRACVERQNLFKPFMSKDDLLDEIGVKIWQELARYRHRLPTYAMARNFAFRVAQNHLRSMVRSKLTVRKRGAYASFVDNEVTSGHQLGSPQTVDIFDTIGSEDIAANGQLAFEAVEHIVSVAIRLIGSEKYVLLCRALCYDWSGNLEPEQEFILVHLGLNRKQLLRLMRKLGKRIRNEVEEIASQH